MMFPNLPCWTALVLGLCGLASGADPASPQACRWFVTAKTGDTCVSLAREWGITYAQFIRNNPTITTCYLTAGTRYCVDDRDALLPTSTVTVTRPTSTLVPPTGPSGTISSTAATATPSISGFTQDGRCGPRGESQTCVGSEFGDCCSPEGWCGSTDEHCGVGCILGFGLCGIGPSSTVSSNTTSISSTATSATTQTTAPLPTAAETTVTITVLSSTVQTFFSLVPQTQTTNITLTQTSLATSTAVITRTQVETTTATATAVFTRTQVETTTLTVAQTSGCAVTVTVPASAEVPIPTSPEVPTTSTPSETSTSTLSVTSTITLTDTSTSTSAPATSSTPASSSPSPIQPGTTSSCKQWYRVKEGDVCDSIVKQFRSFSLQDFYRWNPSVGSDCKQLWLGYYVCIGVGQYAHWATD